MSKLFIILCSVIFGSISAESDSPRREVFKENMIQWVQSSDEDYQKYLNVLFTGFEQSVELLHITILTRTKDKLGWDNPKITQLIETSREDVYRNLNTCMKEKTNNSYYVHPKDSLNSNGHNISDQLKAMLEVITYDAFEYCKKEAFGVYEKELSGLLPEKFSNQ